nr:MAG TPA: hypothetical protein [Caudoviricetes sp.]
MTEANFDAWIEEVRRKVTELSDMLDAKPVDELSDTEIRDKDGVVHDLAELAKSDTSVDNTGVALHMAVHDYYTLDNVWVSSGGFSHSSERLAKLIQKHADDPDVEITVYKF